MQDKPKRKAAKFNRMNFALSYSLECISLQMTKHKYDQVHLSNFLFVSQIQLMLIFFLFGCLSFQFFFFLPSKKCIDLSWKNGIYLKQFDREASKMAPNLIMYVENMWHFVGNSIRFCRQFDSKTWKISIVIDVNWW